MRFYRRKKGFVKEYTSWANTFHPYRRAKLGSRITLLQKQNTEGD
jgi:hypothetical protein